MILTLLTSLVVAALPLLPPESATPFVRGLVIESVARGGAADVAGLRDGDLVTTWSQGTEEGAIASPLLLADVEFGRLPRGPVVLHGMRNGVPLRVEAPPDAVGLGLTARPAFAAETLDLYTRGRALVDSKDVEAGVALWREAANRVRVAEADSLAGCWLLGRIGDALAVVRRGDEARGAYDQAFECAEVEDTRAAATILEWRAHQEIEFGDPEAALAAFETTARLRDAHPASAPLSSIEALFSARAMQRMLGRSSEAARELADMLALVEREAPERLLVARVLLHAGQLQQLGGDIDAAGETFQRAAGIAERALPDSSTWARVQTGLGGIAGTRGDLATMEEMWRRAAEHQIRTSPDSLDAARAFVNLSAVATVRGDLDAARHWGEAAETVLAPLPVGRNIRAAALVNLARAAVLQGDTGAALRALERSAGIIRSTAARSEMAAMLDLGLAEAYLARGDWPAARAHADAAVETAAQFVPNALAFPSTLIARGRVARREEDWDVAEVCFEWALERLDQLGASEHVVATEPLQALAALARHRGDLVGAERYLRRAVALLESKRGRVGRSDEERTLFASSFHGVYRDLVDLLAGQGRAADAFQVLETSRARSLLSMLAARDLTFEAEVPGEVERERRAVNAAYERALDKRNRLSPGSGEAKTLETTLTALRERYTQLEVQIRQASPRLAALREPELQDAAGVAQHLDRDTLFVAYSVGLERTIAFSIANGGADALQAHVIPVGDEALRRQVADWRRQLQANPPPPRFRAQARALHDLLLGPMAGRLATAHQIVISADGPLQGLPFAALRDARGFLAERKAIALVPSGTVYAQQAGNRSGRVWTTPVAFGDPHYDSGTFPELAGSRREVMAVASVHRDTRTFVGQQATESQVKSLKGDRRFVHFAVHGVLDARTPLDSALALSSSGKSQGERDNGLLHAWEIFERVRLDADLIALSACESAVGADRPGEGLVGLTRAFVYAGARSVLASLWSVGDASTAPFMKVFYERWRQGDTKAEALRKAQVDAIRRGQRPLRWAAFQIYGDDR